MTGAPTEIPELGSGNEANSTVEPYRHPFDSTATIVSAVILLPQGLFGMLTNFLTVFVIWQSKKLKTIFNYFIMSLCISDFISALFSPLFLYRRTWGFDNWIISSFLCKLFWAADFGTSVSTSFHILCFSFLRLFSIMRPHDYKVIKPIHAKVCICVIWVLSLGSGFVPFFVWMSPRKINRNIPSIEQAWPSCTIIVEWLPAFRKYVLAGYPIFFYAPLSLIVVCSVIVSGFIFMRRQERVKAGKKGDGNINSSEAQRQQKENQAVMQLALIVGSYMFGYIPLTAYHVYATAVKAETHEERVFHWWFGMVEYWCLRFSESLNPVFYNMASSTMRSETLAVLRRMFGCSRKSKYEEKSGSMQVSALSKSVAEK